MKNAYRILLYMRDVTEYVRFVNLLLTLDTGLFCVGVRAMVDQVLNVSGEHIEVWCVPSATYVPGIDQSQNKMFHIRVFVTIFFFNSFVVSSLVTAKLVYLEMGVSMPALAS